MRTANGMTVYRMEALFSLLVVLLAATHCQAAGVNETGVNSTDLQVVAAQPMMVSCDAPSPLEKYDSYCEGLRADYFLLPKQRRAPSLTGLTPNVSTFVTSLNDTAAALSFKGVNALIAAKTYSFAVRYTGVLFFDIAGRYDFSLNSPAGTRLTINGNTITFNQGSNASTPTTGYTFSKAGYLPIELVFFNENSVPSLKVQWTGPADAGVMTVIEGSSIQFNCSNLQNNTNSVPAKTSSFCPGISAVYYRDWTNSSFATATGGAATYAIYEQGLNHWSTTTTPYWARLPPTLRTSFSGRFHGQLWIPLPGTYTFKLQATRAASLFIGNERVLNSSAVNGVAQAKTVTYSFATAGYAPVGLNFISRKVAPTQAGVLRLAWKGPNSPAFKVVYGFNHPCSSFVACSNTTTDGALPAEVVGTPPAGTTVESASAIRTASLATFIPNSNVTFTLGFPGLNAEDPGVEDVSYFAREAVANAAGLRLESVWTVPSLDDAGEVVFPIGAYFTSVASAMRFYNLVNLRPDVIFSNSAGLYDFYPITVSSPDMGTRVASSSATVQPPRRVARLASADGDGDDIPLPPTPVPTLTATPNATVAANATSNELVNSPSPTAAPTPTAAAPEAVVSPVPSIPAAIPSTPVATPVAPAPAPEGTQTPVSTPAATPVAPGPGNGGAGVPLPAVTPAAIAPAPEGTDAPVPSSTDLATPVAIAPAPEAPVATPVAAAPAPAPEGTAVPLPTATPYDGVPGPEGTVMPASMAPAPAPDGPVPVATPVAAAPAPEGTVMPVTVATPVAMAPAPEGTAVPVPAVMAAAPAPEGPVPVATPVAAAPAPEGTVVPVTVATPVAMAPAPEGTAMPVAAAPAPEGSVMPVPTATPVAAAPAPEGTAVPAPAAPAPVAEETATPTATAVVPALAPEETATATPVAPAPSPVPADLPPPVPTAVPTPMAPSPAPLAPETPAPTPTPTSTGRTVGGPRVPAATPYGTPTPTATPYGSPVASPTAAPTPMAYAPSGAVPGSAPAPAPGVPSSTMSAGTPSPPMYPSPGMVGSPSGAPAPYATPQTGGVSPIAGPVMGDVSAPSRAPTPYPAPPPGGIAPSGGPASSGSVSAPSPAPTPYATPYATPSPGSPLSGPSPVSSLAPSPGPAPTPYLVPPYVNPSPTPYPASSPITTSPSAYSPPPSPYYSPVTVPTPTSPALTIPEDAILVYAPPPTPITFASPSPAPITYYSPSPAIRGSPVGITNNSPSPSPGGYYSPTPTQTPAPTSPPSRLFGPPSPIFDTPPSTPRTPISTPPTDFCAYGGSSYFVPYSQRAGGYLVPCPSMTTPGSPRQPSPYGDSPNPYMSPNPYDPVTPAPQSSPAVSPTPARLPAYYGLPVTCPPGAASCRPGPYAYYAPRGNQPLTPAAEAALLGQSPSVRSPSPLPSPRPIFGPALAPAPAPAMGPVVAPAPAPTAQCACDPTDATPRSVKLEVLSTAYNSTTSDTIRFNAYLTFSHPTRSLNSSQVRVFTRQPSDDLIGTVTTPGIVSLLEPISQNCAFYSLKGYVMESNPFAVNTTSIFLAAGGDILDACGSPFNVTVTRVEQANRLSGLLYATGVAYSEEAGALLDGNVLDLALAFTQPVPRLSANMFSVTGPPQMTSTDLERVDGSDSYFTFSVTLPENYYGSVRVAMNRAGRQYLSSINPSAVAPASLTLNRADPVTQGSLVNTTMTKARSL